MKVYHKFIGIDIGKFNFVVALHGEKTTNEYDNTSAGITKFIKEYKPHLAKGLCIVEPTGGYELSLLYTLCEQHYNVHRGDTRKIKSFIRSFGNAAKTDALDAKALAYYGVERGSKLELFEPKCQQEITLFQLVRRRGDLKQMRVAEKNRLKGPSMESIRSSCEVLIKVLTEELKKVEEEIEGVIASDPTLKAKQTCLKTIDGIGNIVAFELLILLPELGKLSNKQIASLAGLAPRANESGRFKGYRKTGHGRGGVKPILFMAAMAAVKSKSNLREFYEGLLARGKKKMVALTAVMRKIIVIANARLKSLELVET